MKLEAFAKKVEVILHTVNHNEFEAAACKMKKPYESFPEDKGVFVINRCQVMGMFASKKTAIVRTEQGEGASETLTEAITEKFPNAKLVIAVGVGYAFDEKYKFGDVLVSTQICNFKNMKFSKGQCIDRGETIDVDKNC